MAGFSDYLETAILNWFRGTTFPAAPASVYVALYSAAPTDAGGGTEVTTTIRVAGRVAAVFGAPSGNSIANSVIVDFGAAAGGADLTHFGALDAAVAGNLLGWGPLTNPQTVSPGNLVSYPIGSLTITAD